MKKVLVLISVYPYPGEGQRTYRLAARNQESLLHGWETILLTPEKLRKKPLPLNNAPADDTMKIYEAHLPIIGKLFYKSEKQHNAKENNGKITTLLRNVLQSFGRVFFRFISLPDPLFLLYVIPMYRASRKIIKEMDIDAITTICSPFSEHLVGLMLKKATGLPWLVEFRDPWVINSYFPKSKANFLHRQLEKKVIEKADKVVFYDGIQIPDDYFYTAYPHVEKDKFRKLPFMGLDTKELEDIIPEQFEQYTITYAGTFYWRGHDPGNFLKGLYLFLNERSLTGDHIRVNFLGNWEDKYTELAASLGIDNTLRVYGWVPRKQCLQILKGSDLLLYINLPFPGETLSISQKIWDYIGLRKPILVLAKPDYKSAIYIQKNNLGIVAEMDDPQQIKEALSKMYDYHLSKTIPFPPTEDLIRSLDHRNSIREFIRCLDRIAE